MTANSRSPLRPHAPRRYLVTGAGSGIGRAVAIKLAARGGRIGLVGRRRKPLEQTAESCAQAGGRGIALPADVADEEQIVPVIESFGREWGGLEGLVNNAGHASYGTIETTSIGEWQRLFAVHVTGAFLVSRAALAWLRRGQQPAIVNVASNLGLVGLRGAAAYCAAKAALINLTRAMALDHAAEGIRVNAACPGAVRTDMLLADRGDGVDGEQRLQRLARVHPLGRVAEPDEVADVIVRLLAPELSFVTGAVIAVDGGSSAGFPV
ncbi:MAG: SDR family oxidoreductase [Acidobacteriota bacterium]|nr:MAG: SDR family oxidoreductase [Acidobacteriota bacterium]